MGLSVGREGDFSGSLDIDDVLVVIEENDVSGIAALEQPHFLLGFGIEDTKSGIHGDEEYLYVVELPPRSPFVDPGEWTVKVSADSGFPRWDGPTEDAFERANWQYEGSLSGAIEELVADPA